MRIDENHKKTNKQTKNKQELQNSLAEIYQLKEPINRPCHGFRRHLDE